MNLKPLLYIPRRASGGNFLSLVSLEFRVASAEIQEPVVFDLHHVFFAC